MLLQMFSFLLGKCDVLEVHALSCTCHWIMRYPRKQRNLRPSKICTSTVFRNPEKYNSSFFCCAYFRVGLCGFNPSGSSQNDHLQGFHYRYLAHYCILFTVLHLYNIGDELLTDIYPIKLVHEVIYEVQGKVSNRRQLCKAYSTTWCNVARQITTETTNVDDNLIGANPSADEDTGASADPSSLSGCNVVLANRLVETSYSKKDFRAYFKVSAHILFII